MPLNTVQMNFAPYDDGAPGVVTRMLSLFAGPRTRGTLDFSAPVEGDFAAAGRGRSSQDMPGDRRSGGNCPATARFLA